MSYVTAAPEALAAAAGDLTGIGEALRAATAAAAPSTTSLVAAAGDEVSTAIATLFSEHAQSYQALSAQMAAFHDRFMNALAGAGGSYASAEAANATPLQTIEQDLLGAVNAPTQVLFGRGLIGDGANGTAPGQAGGAGGLLIGNGGNG
ncbi:PE family protein, partial [Mycobacterium marinum]